MDSANILMGSSTRLPFPLGFLPDSARATPRASAKAASSSGGFRHAVTLRQRFNGGRLGEERASCSDPANQSWATAR